MRRAVRLHSSTRRALRRTLDTTHKLRALYREVGSRIRGELATWRGALLVPDHALADELGIEPEHAIKVTNGALACRLIVTGPR